jgi:hypothetical protein
LMSSVILCIRMTWLAALLAASLLVSRSSSSCFLASSARYDSRRNLWFNPFLPLFWVGMFTTSHSTTCFSHQISHAIRQLKKICMRCQKSSRQKCLRLYSVLRFCHFPFCFGNA